MYQNICGLLYTSIFHIHNYLFTIAQFHNNALCPVVCCHNCFMMIMLRVSATSWSLVQRSPTEYGVSKTCDREASKNEVA
jgi:hypothetical protein